MSSENMAVAQASSRGEAPGNGVADDLIIQRHGENGGSHSVTCKWNIAGFSQKQKVLYSKYFEVGGYDCRLLVYPSGDAQALPGYMSLYLQISDPGSSSSKWDCFASYQLAVRNLADDTKSVRRDSWHRFSAKKRSHGWCDFAALSTLLDAKQGFLGPGGTIQVSTDITILDESVSFTRESDLGGSTSLSCSDVYSGKFVWRVQNFSVFQPLLRTQKIMSPAFPAGECALRMSVYQSTVGGVDYLSLCLESKDTERTGSPDRTCWCLFRLAVQPQQAEGGKTIHRDSYGRFACDGRSGDNTSLGWNDFMKMEEFLAQPAGYLEGDTAVFSTSFHVIRESTSLVRHLEPRGALVGGSSLVRGRDKRKAASRESEWAGRFQWRLENFTRLKDLLKKRKITGLCIKSRRFTVGGRDCRLIVYPRGQSQPPTFLSVFLEVTDPSPPSPDWTCFVSHRLSVVNQRGEADRSVSKESQNRYSKSAKDWGWREFVSLTTLFDADAGFLVNDAVVFSAEVLVLKESSEAKKIPLPLALPHAAPVGAAAPAAAAAAATPITVAPLVLPTPPSPPSSSTTAIAASPAATPPAATSAAAPEPPSKTSFTWRIENFLAFKDVVETRKIFSRFFSAGPCDVRVGLYESFDSLCVYLESDTAVTPPLAPSSGTPGGGGIAGDASTAAAPPADKPVSYWVRYRAAILNQRHPEKTQWREGSVYTRSWNNSVLQFPRVGAAISGGDQAGLVVRDVLAVAVEILDCRPWTQDADAGPTPPAAAPMTPTAAGQRIADGGMGETAAGAAAGRNSPDDDDTSEGEEDEDSGSSAGSEEDDEDDEEDDDPRGDAEVEDALGRWLSAAGLELLGIDNHPPMVGDVAAVQSTLDDMLHSQPGAIPMFVASLRMYMSSLPRVQRLLLPCLSTAPTTSGAIYGVAPAVISILAGIAAMRQPLFNMLVDVMLDHTLTAKMHRHLMGSSPPSPSAAAVEGGENEAQPAVDAAGSPPTSPPAKAAAADSGRSARISGSLANTPPDDVEQTLSLILGWMRSIDSKLLPPSAAAASSAAGPSSSPSTPLSPLHKVSMLLADAPRALQPDIVALVPQLVGPQEHTAAAGALLGRLAEASKEGQEAEAALRLPVLAALGALQIDPGVAQKVLQAALEALPSLSDSELPPAIGLVLKLASGNASSCKSAVAAVRQRIKGAASSEEGAAAAAPPSGATEALRLAVVQHSAVASAALAAIREESRACKAATPPEDADACTPAPGGMSRADTHVLLDCLVLPSLRSEALTAIEECGKLGRLDETALVGCLEERRVAAQALEEQPQQRQQAAQASAQQQQQPPEGDGNGAASDGDSSSAESSNEDEAAPRKVTHGPPLASVSQRAFVRAHPLANDPGDGPMSTAIAKQLCLWFPENAAPAGLPHLPAPASADELGGLLGAAESLLRTKGRNSKQLAAATYTAAFKCFADAASQRRVLRSLAEIALSGRDAPVPAADPATVASRATPSVNGPPPAPALASSLLATLASLSPGGSSLVLSVVLEMAAAAQAVASIAQHDSAAAAAKHVQDLAGARAAIAKAETAERRAQDQLSDLETQMARRMAEQRAELAGLASDRKELQAQLRAAEQQIEWVRSERDEERSARAREGREASQRATEAEAQLARLKATRRDEQKRAQKDRSGLAERLRELEEAVERAEGEAARAKGDAGMAVARAEKAAVETRRRAEAAELAVVQREQELAAARAATADRETRLRAALGAQHALEQHLGAERQRLAMLTTGAGLEAAAPADVEAVAAMHETGLRRANALLGRNPPQGGPPHLNSLSPNAKPGPPGGFRPSSQQQHHQQHQQQQQQPNAFARPFHGSLDSMRSLQDGGSGDAGGGLFGAADWRMMNTNNGPPGRHGSAPPAQDVGVDSASMEKLLGLLPSDLLHS